MRSVRTSSRSATPAPRPRAGFAALRHALVLAAFLPLLSLFGCEEDVVGVLGTDWPFTLFGVLSPQLDSQWVRVYPIEDSLKPSVAEDLGAIFTSMDLQTGEEIVWTDSLIQDSFNQSAHVFWAPFRVEHDHTYRVTVRSANGEAATATTTVPPLTELIVQPPVVNVSRVLTPVLIEGNAPRLLRVEVVYFVGFMPAGARRVESDTVSIPYDGLQRKVADGWIVPIELRGDFEKVIAILQRRNGPLDGATGVMLNRIQLRLIAASQEWNPPGGVFDADVLVQPEILSNVENGFGLLVSGYRAAITFTPPDDVVEASRFRAGR